MTAPTKTKRQTPGTPLCQGAYFIRFNQLPAKIGLGKTKIWELINDGEFPKPYELGPRAVGFLSTEIEAWITARIEAGHAETRRSPARKDAAEAKHAA